MVKMSTLELHQHRTQVTSRCLLSFMTSLGLTRRRRGLPCFSAGGTLGRVVVRLAALLALRLLGQARRGHGQVPVDAVVLEVVERLLVGRHRAASRVALRRVRGEVGQLYKPPTLVNS